MNRPITTLFMLESLDGKISTGNSDNLDVDKDFPKINGVKAREEYHEKNDINFINFFLILFIFS